MFQDMQGKMMDRFFKKVDSVVWDLFSGNLGIQTADGISTLSGKGDDAQIELNLMDQFGMAIPAYAQSTPLNSVTEGDIVFANGKCKGWVTDVVKDAEDVPKRFKLMTPSGTTTTWTPPKVSMLGFDSGVMIVRSLINMLPGGNSGLGSMQSMLMPMLMMGGGDVDMESIMPMMLFSQLGTGGHNPEAGAANTMMGGNMMQTMLMMQMLKGGKSGKKTPMSKMLGGNFFDEE